ncbi:XkdX family protein [Paenibacillus sp. FSL R7-0333]
MIWFDRIKYYYDNDLWDIKRLRNVVGKIINEQEFLEITGQKYEETPK